MELNKIALGDCLDLMPLIPDRSVNLVLVDLPYGVTQNHWDSIIPIDRLWANWKRLLKPGGAVVLCAQQPFATTLINSNPRWFRHDLIWRKNQVTGFLNARRAPLRQHEHILVFAKRSAPYHPQMTKGRPYKKLRGARPTANYGPFINGGSDNQGERYPTSILNFGCERGLHRTQKPIALMEYLIKTYSSPGDTVLDNCVGSGTTALAALNVGRNFYAIERDPIIHAGAVERISSRNPTILEVLMHSARKDISEEGV